MSAEGRNGIKKSRTAYSAQNITVAITCRALAILAGFCTRMVFTHTLTQEYVGVNGLFSDILNVLALSELGLSSAITYALYYPIAKGDIEKQKSLMRLFRRFYRVVALIVLTSGLLIIPFMDILIKNQQDIPHLTLIYLLYLVGSVSSYLMTYKQTLIDAHQLSYIGVLYHNTALLLQDALQVAILLATRNFILYVCIGILCTLLKNVAISLRAERMYPYLRDKNVQKLPTEELQDIFRNTRAMLMHKIGGVVVNNTDNLLLSSLVGLSANGIYSNYYLIIGSVRQVLNQVFQAITASVGNLGIESYKMRVQKIFEASFFMGQWMFGLAAICICELIDPIVSICFGPSYVFPREVTWIICLNFYLTGMRQATLVFRDSLGIFWYDRYKSPAEAVINLVTSILLGRKLGAAGIFLGTLISTITTSLWVEPLVLYRRFLHMPARPYFFRYALYASATFLLWFGENQLCQLVTGEVWIVCVKRLLICVTITNLTYLLLYHRTKEFRLLLHKAKSLLSSKISM